MNTALVVTTDGRDLLGATLASARECLPPFDLTVLVDDSGTGAAEAFYGQFDRVVAHDTRQGLGQSVRDGWGEAVDAEWVFHLEDDFTFNGVVPLEKMRRVLRKQPLLAQMVLKRQPVNEREHALGGYTNTPDYQQTVNALGHRWLEHSVGFSFNPCLIPRWAVVAGVGGTESEVNERLYAAEPAVRFGVWGSHDSAPLVNHDGEHRSAGWIV